MVAETFYCEHCNLTLTGKEPYTQHLGGKKHMKKLNALGLKPPAKGATSDPENTEADKDTAITDDLADEIVSTGEAVSVDTAEGNGTASKEGNDTVEEGDDDPVQKAVKANIMGKLAKKRKHYSGNCILCNVHYTSPLHETQHLTGQKHAKKVKIQEGTSGIIASYFCHYCNVRVNSILQMQQHKEGLTHKKKADAAEQAGGPSPAKKMYMPGAGAGIAAQ